MFWAAATHRVSLMSNNTYVTAAGPCNFQLHFHCPSVNLIKDKWWSSTLPNLKFKRAEDKCKCHIFGWSYIIYWEIQKLIIRLTNTIGKKLEKPQAFKAQLLNPGPIQCLLRHWKYLGYFNLWVWFPTASNTHTILFKKTVVENINWTSAWTLQRKDAMLSITHHPEQLTGAEGAASQHWQSPCPTPMSQHSACSWGTISAPRDALLHLGSCIIHAASKGSHCQSLQASFETWLEQEMDFINNLQYLFNLNWKHSQFK